MIGIRITTALMRPSTRCIQIHRFNSNSMYHRIKDFVFSTDKENFHEDHIIRAHNWDNVDRSEWKLIYRDIGASRSFFMISTLLPISFMGFLYIVFDVINNKPADRSDLVRRLQKDANELGILAYVPATCIVLVIALILRVHQIRLLRIYQNRNDVDNFMAISSKNLVAQKQVHFSRESSSAFYYEDSFGDAAQTGLHFVLGNTQINNRKFMLMDDSFVANNYRSYMLNETSIPPRLHTKT